MRGKPNTVRPRGVARSADRAVAIYRRKAQCGCAASQPSYMRTALARTMSPCRSARAAATDTAATWRRCRKSALCAADRCGLALHAGAVYAPPSAGSRIGSSAVVCAAGIGGGGGDE